MSTAPEPGYIPEWDLADRMRKTLRNSGQSVQEVAAYFDVSRNTVGTWINGHITPDLRTLRLWALRFGVPLCWLVDGYPCPDHGGDDGGIPVTTRSAGLAPVVDISGASQRVRKTPGTAPGRRIA